MDADPRVLLVTSTWSTEGYGGEKSVRLLHDALASTGAQVSIAAEKIEGEGDVVRLDQPFQDLVHMIQRDEHDIVHCYNMESLVPVVLAAKATGVPSVITANSYWATCLFADMLFPDGEICQGCSIRGVQRDFKTRDPATVGRRVPAPVGRGEVARRTFFLNRYDAIVALSSASLDQLARGGARPDRMHVVPNLSDPDEILSSPKTVPSEPKVLFVGQLKHVKGVSLLLEAMACVKDTVPEAELTVAGDGPERERLKAQARELGITEAVTFLGYVDPREMPRVYRDHRVLARPSLWVEPFSRVLLEAWSQGIPVVSTRRGAAGDVIVNEETGLLVPADDSDRFAEELARVLEEDTTASRLQEGGLEQARRLTPDAVGPRYASVYETVLGG